jgi:hypothetical protein
MQLAGQLYDAMQGGGGSGDGRSPKYDTTLPAGSGMVIFASECSLKELQYQKNRSDKPPSDPKYIDANLKRSKALSYWISYRQASPLACWTGERNRRTVTAPAPLDKPQSYPRESMQNETYNDPQPDAGGDSMDDVPFARIGDVG